MKRMSTGPSRQLPGLVLILCLLVTGCTRTAKLAPSPTLYVGSSVSPFAATPAALQTTSVPILFGTDRTPAPEKNGHFRYGIGRSHALSVGECQVSIGEDGLTWHELVDLSRESKRSVAPVLRVTRISPEATFAETGNPPNIVDGRESPTSRDVETDERATARLHAMLRDRLSDSQSKDVFIFVHGYANQFEDGAIRMAQLWHFLGRPGVGAIYSWPAGSPGLLRGYTHDRESGEFSIFHFKQFIRAIASSPDVERIHLIGHSRGTDVLITALRELHLQGGGDPAVTSRDFKIGHVILAAPDLDLEVAVQRISAERLGRVAQSVTVYLHAHDRAIGISDWLFTSARRIGQLRSSDLTAKQKEGYSRLLEVCFVDVRVKTDRTGHGYFISNPHVLSDLILVLRDGRPPGEENGRPLTRREGAFWELSKGYPTAPSANHGDKQ